MVLLNVGVLDCQAPNVEVVANSNNNSKLGKENISNRSTTRVPKSAPDVPQNWHIPQ